MHKCTNLSLAVGAVPAGLPAKGKKQTEKLPAHYVLVSGRTQHKQKRIAHKGNFLERLCGQPGASCSRVKEQEHLRLVSAALHLDARGRARARPLQRPDPCEGFTHVNSTVNFGVNQLPRPLSSALSLGLPLTPIPPPQLHAGEISAALAARALGSRPAQPSRISAAPRSRR